MPRVIACCFLVLVFTLSPGLSPANHDEDREHRALSSESRGEYGIGRRHRDRKAEQGEKGNEATGQAAAWIFVLANLKVGVAILARWMNRFSVSESRLGRSATGVSRFLNKHLRKAHYVLNPTALAVAFLHFLLSSCRSSPLPEWGLLMVAVMVLLGLMVRFKVSFKWMRKFLYRVHTASVSFLFLIFVLLTGHLMID